MGVIAYLAMMTVTAAVVVQPSLSAKITPGMFPMMFSVVAAVLGWRVAADRGLHRQTRIAWTWMASSFVLLAISNLLYSFEWHMFPAPPDLFRLAVLPVLVTGLLRLPMRAGGQRQSLKVALDAGTVTAAACGFLWYLQVGPSISAPGATPARIITAMVYPLSDVILIFGLAVVLMRGTDVAVRRPVRLLAFAAVACLIGDAALGYHKSHAGTNDISNWLMFFFLTSQFLLAAAAQQQISSAHRSAPSSEGQRTTRVSRLPYAAVATGFGLLFYVVVKQGQLFPWGGLVLCACGVTTLVSARQMVAQQENHRMAVTDGLTGLANRVRLHEALSGALDRASRQGQFTAVLVTDLNGFKQINDTMGHEAGDRLLVAYGEMLQRATLGSDVAARLGGDEFAVVLHNVGTSDNAEAVARRIQHETEQPVMIGDTPVRVRGSIGIALSGPGELALDELVRRADQAMYEAKRTKAGTWHVYRSAEMQTVA